MSIQLSDLKRDQKTYTSGKLHHRNRKVLLQKRQLFSEDKLSKLLRLTKKNSYIACDNCVFFFFQISIANNAIIIKTTKKVTLLIE